MAAFLYTLYCKYGIDITENESGKVVKSILICLVSSAVTRMAEGWSIETDSTRMASVGKHQFDQIVNMRLLSCCYKFLVLLLHGLRVS